MDGFFIASRDYFRYNREKEAIAVPFSIVRNDIVNMQADAIVNTANPDPIIGAGTDSAIHAKAGKKLLAARQKIGILTPGQCAITPGFKLDAKYVIHTVGPIWSGGTNGEEEILRSCYENALSLAAAKRCKSIAFPLISAGNYGFPKAKALEIAVDSIRSFLSNHDMDVHLVVFDREAYRLSEKLFFPVFSYIDENYVGEKEYETYLKNIASQKRNFFRRKAGKAAEVHPEDAPEDNSIDTAEEYAQSAPMVAMPMASMPEAPATNAKARKVSISLLDRLKKTDAGFSETMLKLIDRTGKKDSEIYKKANIDRRLFSKIRSNPTYQPSKQTAIALAIALELNLDETKDLIGRAGYALTNSSKFDVIIEYFITNRIYDIYEINMTLFEFDQSLLGA